MLDDLRIGDRVRVKGRHCVPTYYPGAKGQVLDGPTVSPSSGAIYYVVAMDKDATRARTVFLADEIEADV
jgi:hypothetical protein